MNYRIWLPLSILLTSLLAWQLGGLFGYRQLERESREDAFRYGQLLGNEIKRYEPIVALAAQHPLLAETLRRPDDAPLILEANLIMQLMATIVASSDVYLLDPQGLVIAASNYQQQDSFIAQDLSYRPYFIDALAQHQGQFYFALGTTSAVRGLYFAYPILADQQAIGVIAMKVQVDELEAQWRRPSASPATEMLVLDNYGISFLASRPEWLYQAFEPLTKAQRERLASERRYADQPLPMLPLRRLGQPLGSTALSERLQIDENGSWREYLRVRHEVAEQGWSLNVLVETTPVRWVRLRFVLGALVLLTGLLSIGLYLRERYRREAELAERGVQLEQRVAERTADLKTSNQQLRAEIAERQRAEHELKATQQELIQAAKLAVLGQMSAGLNHELNQPLTALQGYASNSRRFLQRGDTAMVEANLGEILALCEKMAELIRQFKVFARKSEGLPSQVDLRLPIDAALKLLFSRNDGATPEIHWQRPEQPVMVHGDLIRIEQVMVNLLSNAVQAVDGSAQPRIDIDLHLYDDRVECRVRDNGPGLPANSEQVFEPFFTTKPLKQGLGLGLSISRQISEALGGSLVGQNRAEGGAEFIMTLRRRQANENPA
mgnify:CR=1 FL=1